MMNAALSVVASIPSPPDSRRSSLGPFTHPLLRAVHHRGDHRRDAADQPPPHQARRRAVGRHRHRPARRAARDHRRAHLPRGHPPGLLLRPGHEPPGRSSTSGRAASRSTAPSSAARSAPGSAAGGPASGSRRSPTRWPPASSSPRRSDASATGSTRSCSAFPPMCRGVSRSPAPTPPSRPDWPTEPSSTRRSCTR